MASSALTCNSSRVLTPEEAYQTRAVIEKPSARALYDLMLYTGLRLVEVKQLAENPGIFDQERRTITIKSGKAKASQISRNVCLSDKGLLAVEEYLKNPICSKEPVMSGRIKPYPVGTTRPSQALPGQEQSSNPTGITVRTSRKTWESWLLAAYPDKVINIVLSQGHTETTALRHYFNISWTQAEREAIKEQVKGWGCTS